MFNAFSPFVLVSRGQLAEASFVVQRSQTLGASTLRSYVAGAGPQERKDLSRFLETLAVVIRQDSPIEAQLLQDVFALTVADSHDKTFVEVGAAKSRELSNTFLLQDSYGWSGLLIEPNPKHVRDLQVRAVPGKVTVLPVAIGPASTITLIDAAELSAVIDADSDPSHERTRQEALKDGRTFEVSRIPLNKALQDGLGAPRRLGFLSIDVEGAELAVLRSNEWESWSFWAIALEHNYRASSLQAYTDFLTKRGYRPFLPGFSAWDSWFVHNDW